jgi:hypothetical protein
LNMKVTARGMLTFADRWHRHNPPGIARISLCTACDEGGAYHRQSEMLGDGTGSGRTKDPCHIRDVPQGEIGQISELRCTSEPTRSSETDREVKRERDSSANESR